MMSTWTDVNVLLPAPTWIVLVATPRSKEKVKFGKCIYDSLGNRYWVTYSTDEKWWLRHYSPNYPGAWYNPADVDEHEREVTHWMAFPALPRAIDDLRE